MKLLLWSEADPEVFYEKAVLKIFAIFTGKHLCWSPFLIKLQTFSPATLLKRNCSRATLFKKYFSTGLFL